jgi:hypothetical protein
MLAMGVLLAACATPADWAEPTVAAVKARSFPELAAVPLAVAAEGEPFVGGRAWFAPAALVGLAPRDMRVQLARDLLDEGAGEAALR